MFDQHNSTRSVPTTVEEGSEDSSPRSSPEDGDDHAVEEGGAFCIGTPNASVVGTGPPSPGPVDDEEDPPTIRLQTPPMKPPQDAPAATTTMKGSRSFPESRRRRQTMCLSDYTEKPDLRRKESSFIGLSGTLSTLALGSSARMHQHSYHPRRVVSLLRKPPHAKMTLVPQFGPDTIHDETHARANNVCPE